MELGWRGRLLIPEYVWPFLLTNLWKNKISLCKDYVKLSTDVAKKSTGQVQRRMDDQLQKEDIYNIK